MRTLKVPFITAVCTLLFLAFVSIGSTGEAIQEEGVLEVTFFDVGQGDAIFIQSPSGTQVLIDGGKGSAVLGELQKRMGFFDRDIDMIVATHLDLDHIGGLIAVLERYRVHTILITENEGESAAAQVFKERVEAEGAQVLYARRGQVFDLGLGEKGSTTLTILFPDIDPTELESNTASIVARLVYGESEYLLTGDSPKEIEEYLVRLGSGTLRSDVLKVGHHGSRTSTSDVFLSAVRPSVAIISAGKDNSYGHPHEDVVRVLNEFDVIQKSTADEGSIVSFSDGQFIYFTQ